MTKYARDEFDKVPETPTRQGVHRAAAESRRRSLVPVLAVGALALVIGLVAFLFLPQRGFNSAGSSSAVTAQQPASAGSPDPASEEPSAGATPSGATSSDGQPSTAPPEDVAVDKSQPVAIYNATGTAGLATRVGTTIVSDGWTAGPLGNWGGPPQASSVIFYNGPEQKANAEALASLLSIPTLVDSAEFNMPLVVVLGPGFK
jgi:hypothetical protein